MSSQDWQDGSIDDEFPTNKPTSLFANKRNLMIIVAMVVVFTLFAGSLGFVIGMFAAPSNASGASSSDAQSTHAKEIPNMNTCKQQEEEAQKFKTNWPEYDLPKVYSDIRRTQEYQIKLEAETWGNREGKIREMYEHFNKAAGQNFTIENADISYRHQVHISASKCVHQRALRIRQYTAGTKKGITTVDIKSNDEKDLLMANRHPYTPAFKYLKLAYEKIEQDVGFCSTKYSRSSRVHIDFDWKTFKKCKQISEIWPNVWDGDTSADNNLLSFREVPEDQTWFVMENYGQLPESKAHIKTTLTLQYLTLQAALEGKLTPNHRESEWSMRLFLPSNSFSAEGLKQDDFAIKEAAEVVAKLRDFTGVYGRDFHECPPGVREEYEKHHHVNDK